MREIGLALLVLTLSSCSDSLKPSDVAGSYNLITIQGSTPPKVVVEEPGCQQTVTGGTLALNLDGSFSMQLDEVTACPTPTQPNEIAVNWFGSYRLEGRTLVLSAVGDVSVEYRSNVSGPTLLLQVEPPYGQLIFDSGRID
jgi:hypothetical protein